MKFDITSWCEDNIDNARMNSTKQLVGDCPWCGKPKHLYVDSEEGHYICHSCQNAGKYLVGLLAQVEGISVSQARKYIMKNHVEFRRKETPQSLVQKISQLGDNEDDEVKKINVPMPPEFIPVYANGRWRYPVYLKTRKIKKKTAKIWKLGWARKGRYGKRLIIPVKCPNGNSLTARDITNKQEPKYLNPPGADHSRLLLGWDHHRVTEDVVLVEGPMDTIKLWQHGISSLALMGKVLHSPQLDLLSRKPKNTAVTVMLDPEEKGAPYEIANQLICVFEYVYIAKLPDGIDPGSSTLSQAKSALSQAVRYKGERTKRIIDLVNNSRKNMENFYS